MPIELRAVFAGTLGLVVLALAFTAAEGRRGRLTSGALIQESRQPRRLRSLGVVLLLALAAAIAMLGGPALGAWSAALLLAAALLTWIRPAALDRVCGESGVRVGWRSLGYAALPEWRLTGSHLRVRMSAEWEALDLDPPHHERVRAILLGAAPERESRFHDRQEPPLFARKAAANNADGPGASGAGGVPGV